MSKDQFADLLSGFTKKDDSKLTLAERQKSSTPLSVGGNARGASPWANFDILDKPSSKPQTPLSTSNDLFEGFGDLGAGRASQGNQQQHAPPIFQTQPATQEHLFEGFPSSSTTTPVQNHIFQGVDLLDDFNFNSSSSTPSTQLNGAQPPQQSQQQSFDDLFAVFDAPPEPSLDVTSSSPSQPSLAAQQPVQSRQSSRQPSRPTTTQPANNDAFDEAVASIVDMGFSAEQAVRALKHTRTGSDVQDAINFIMTEAHNTSRAKAGLPPNDSKASPSSASQRRGNGADDYIQGFSKLLGGVTKKVMDVQKQFMAPPSANDGRPAWMRDAEKHKRRAGDYDDDPEMISTEELNKLHLGRERPQPPAPRKSSVSRPSRPTQRPTHAVPTPRASQPKPEVDLFAPLPTRPNQDPEVDLFSSPKPLDVNSDMKSSSNRRSARPTPPTHTPTPKISRPSVHISSTQMEFFKDSREQGGISFKNGDFTTALQHYETALSALPQGHIYQILSMSNVITCYMKVGENRKVIEMSQRALDLIGEGRGVGEEIDGKSMKDFWVKIMSKRAEAFEHLEKHKDALDTWQVIIENGAADKHALDAKRRLQNMLHPKPKATAKPRASASPVSASKKTTTTKVVPVSEKSYEAVDRLKNEHKQQEKFEEEKFKLHDVVEAKIDAWRNGKEDNLRALLASLDTILWPEAQWKKVGMSDLVIPKKVKISYMKAVAKTHPDKVPSDASSEQKMIAQSVFVVLNAAWESFKSQNGIS